MENTSFVLLYQDNALLKVKKPTLSRLFVVVVCSRQFLSRNMPPYLYFAVNNNIENKSTIYKNNVDQNGATCHAVSLMAI